ncbi:MAG: non-homologous end-joining DNA ligase [Chloroflexota bacterium]
MSETRTIDGHEIELSHLDKVFFPESGITKGDVLDYYERVAPHMLPHVRERAMTMHRYPDGIDGEDFYQQNMPDYFPDWIARVDVDKEDGKVTHVVCNDTATLVYIANQGALVNHVWLSRRDRIRHPDRMIVDLDPPHDGTDASALRSAALLLRDTFHELGLVPFLSTTGSAGLHLYVPLKRELEFDEVREFGREVVEQLASKHPDSLTTEQRKQKRGRRIYLDVLRNSYAHTAVALYSVRAKPGAPVATPLAWEELQQGPVESNRYTVQNIFRRLGQREDPWKGFEDQAGSIRSAWEQLKHSAID